MSKRKPRADEVAEKTQETEETAEPEMNQDSPEPQYADDEPDMNQGRPEPKMSVSEAAEWERLETRCMNPPYPEGHESRRLALLRQIATQCSLKVVTRRCENCRRFYRLIDEPSRCPLCNKVI
jgi:hypothetical protein